MRGRAIAIALVMVLGAAVPLWAGPFSEVPAGHWAYQACAGLAAAGVVSAPGGAAAFSGRPQLTRFEFGIALLDPLTNLDRELAALPARADPKQILRAALRALNFTPHLSEDDIARLASDLRRLSLEFADILGSLNFDAARAAGGLQLMSSRSAVRDWRSEALSSAPGGPPTSALAGDPATPNTVRVPIAHGTVALTYRSDGRPPELLDYLAISAGDLAVRDGATIARAEPSPRDPSVSRLRTAYEYDLSSALTLSLAYEEIARRGLGLSPLDGASLASFAVGYQLTTSTSVNLSYSLLEYANYVFDTPKVRDRVAETSVSIAF
jgi:hypothetical protein